jgi:ribosomal-protein-alanine N-acetyltransferase
VSAPPQDVVVRRAREDDLAAVERIERASFSDPWSRGTLWSELQTDSMRCPLVAEAGGEVRGYLMAWRVVDQLHVLNLATDPARRRAGVATALLAAALGGARAAGLREITLEVREGNVAARSFYLRHGFAVVGRRPRYYGDNNEDALIMTRDLTAEQPAE